MPIDMRSREVSDDDDGGDGVDSVDGGDGVNSGDSGGGGDGDRKQYRQPDVRH